MSKSRKDREREKQRQPRPPPQKPKMVWRVANKFFAGVLETGTILGAIVLWPRMTATPSWLFDPSNAYSETFTIANTGFLFFKQVRIGIGLCAIETVEKDFFVTGDHCAGNDPHFMMSGMAWSTPELRRDETFSVTLSDVLTVATEKYRADHPGVVGDTKMLSPLRAANIILKVTCDRGHGFGKPPSTTDLSQKSSLTNRYCGKRYRSLGRTSNFRTKPPPVAERQRVQGGLAIA